MHFLHALAEAALASSAIVSDVSKAAFISRVLEELQHDIVCRERDCVQGGGDYLCCSLRMVLGRI
jgi:hypothetical protein